MPADPVQLSKFLSFVLRHKPDAIGLTLDPQGWASIDELIERANAAGTQFDHDELQQVVETSDKSGQERTNGVRSCIRAFCLSSGSWGQVLDSSILPIWHKARQAHLKHLQTAPSMSSQAMRSSTFR